jgi:hypothetical protein
LALLVRPVMPAMIARMVRGRQQEGETSVLRRVVGALPRLATPSEPNAMKQRLHLSLSAAWVFASSTLRGTSPVLLTDLLDQLTGDTMVREHCTAHA